jgi:bifunctional oligoribonuclease and PAP phosphatase NrnA
VTALRDASVPAREAGQRERVIGELRDGERFLLVTHENPDGDAIGSLVAMHEILGLMGKDTVMFMPAAELPLPYEYRFFQVEGLAGVVPEDIEQRTIVFLDCGNIDRTPLKLPERGARTLNLDHHHDNTGFGTVNHVVPEASCTAEIVWDLMADLGVEPTTTIAEALYVALVTDTGRFMYENTGPRAHAMAGALIAVGVEPPEIHRRLFEGIPFGKLELLGRALVKVERYDGGQLTITRLSADDYSETGSEEDYSEGVVDHLRSVAGTAVAGLVRDLLGPGQEGRRKVSLRAVDERVDVSSIARARGGGGHRQAAGFSTDMPWEELVAFLRAEISAQV